MKKILSSILMILMLVFVNGCSKNSQLYVLTSDTSKFDQYAKDTIGAYIYANYKTDDVTLGKGIIVYGENDYTEVIYPIWLDNEIIDTYQIIQYVNEYMSNFSKNHVEQLNNAKDIVTKDNPLKIFKKNHELYYSYDYKVIHLNGENIDTIDLNQISFDGSSMNVKDKLKYTEYEENDSVKLYAFTKDTSEYDKYAQEYFLEHLVAYTGSVNRNYELGRGILVDNKVLYPIWQNNSIVGTYSVIQSNGGLIGVHTIYTYALNDAIGKTSLASPLKLFKTTELCYVLGNEVYGTSSGKPVLIKDFDLSTLSFTGGKAINVRDTLECKTSSYENSVLYGYTTNTDKYDEYANKSFKSDMLSYYGYENNALVLGKGMSVFGDESSQVIYPVWKNDRVTGLYKVIQVDNTYYSTYFIINIRTFDSAQGSNHPICFYEIDNELYYLFKDDVYKIEGINVYKVKDINVDNSIFESSEIINVNEKL